MRPCRGSWTTTSCYRPAARWAAAAVRWCWRVRPGRISLARPPGQVLTGATVAVPGARPTAYLLFRLWSADRPPARIEVVPFHEIMPGVAAGRYHAGLVLHQARFTYPRRGLT